MLLTIWLRLRKVETPAQGHTAREEPELDTGVCGSRHLLATQCTHRREYMLSFCGSIIFSNPCSWNAKQGLRIPLSSLAGLMTQIIDEAKRQDANKLRMHAQTQAVPFYEHFGFKPIGDIFIEAGISHIMMELHL